MDIDTKQEFVEMLGGVKRERRIADDLLIVIDGMPKSLRSELLQYRECMRNCLDIAVNCAETMINAIEYEQSGPAKELSDHWAKIFKTGDVTESEKGL